MKPSPELSGPHCSLLNHSPTCCSQHSDMGSPALGEYLRLRPLLCDRCGATNLYGPKERTYQNSRIQLSDEDRANQSHAQFKTLAIRMLTEMVQYGHKI